MKEPIWIPREVVLATHDALLNRFGGLAGVRDEGLLESALLRPQNLFSYGETSLFAMAASYSVGIIKNHPFLDGNKRIGFMAAYIFLGANHLSVEATEEEVVERTLALAASAIGEADYAAWLERVCRPV
jgi:death-on-curing protein